MKVMNYSGPIEIITMVFEPGEKLLESICSVIKEHDIRNGVVVSGIATTKKCAMHYINHTDFPSENSYYSVDKPLELGSISGIIANGEPHLHIVVGHKEDDCWVGHLENDTEIAYLAELCILKCNGLHMMRRKDARGTMMLGPGDPDA
jgi:predicted DNA-binding protein with PD1-like motif